MAGVLQGILGIKRVTLKARDPATGLPKPPIEVDASIEESHTTTVAVTRHPVYKGIPVADNGRAEPDSLTVTVFFSDVKTRIDEAIQVTAAAISKGISYGASPACFDTFELLRQYAKDVMVWEVETSLKAYDNMVLESVEAPRNASTGQGLTIPLRFTELRTALIEVGTSVKKRKLSLTKAKDKGGQAPSKAPSPRVEKSVLAGAVDAFKK